MIVTTPEREAVTDPGHDGRAESRSSPLHVVAALAAGPALWYAAGPLHDFDSLWHPEIGAQITRLHRLGHLPAWWLGVPEPHAWLTSQWLSEVGMHVATGAGGWRALIAVNLVLMLALLGTLWFVLVRGRPALIAVPVFVLVLAGTAGAIQERPQTVSLVLLPWLAWVCWRLAQGRPRPPLLLIVVASVLWAQFHGLWILAPAAFALVAAGLLLDRPRPLASAAQPAALCLLASLAGVINPHGLGSFALPFQFRSATSTVSEWLPTTFAHSFTICWGVLLLVTFGAWARSRGPVPRPEVLWVLAWTVFGLQSFRSVTPALLLIAPFTLAALFRLDASRGVVRAAAASASARESRILGGAALLVLAAMTALAGMRVSDVDPVADVPGASIAAWVARQPGPLRIWSAEGPTGALIGLSDHRARLVIDGRADLWGAAYTERIQDAEKLAPGWQATLNSFGPQAVVTVRTSALATTLSATGWQARISDQHFVLLTPGPNAPGSGVRGTA